MAEQEASAAGGGAAQPVGSGEAAGASPAAATTPPANPEGDAALKAAQDAMTKARDANVAAVDPTKPQPLTVPKFGVGGESASPGGMDLLGDVNLNVKIELGRTKMLVEDVLRLTEGSVVELDKLAGDPVDVYVNDRHVARGEVLVLNDNFCVRISEITGAIAGGPAAAATPVQQAAA
jgi:flagellar motor switch protein FliN/FliY